MAIRYSISSCDKALVINQTLIHGVERRALGDYDRAKALIAKYGQSTPEIESVKARLTDIPVDIEPVFIAAGEKM